LRVRRMCALTDISGFSDIEKTLLKHGAGERI
jgi:hypothetical protein